MATAGNVISGADSDDGSLTPSEPSDREEKSEHDSDYETEHEEEGEQDAAPNVVWTGYGKKTPVIVLRGDVVIKKKGDCKAVGGKLFTPAINLLSGSDIPERYHMAYKMGNTDCRIVRSILNSHGLHEVHPNSSDYNIMWTGSHLKPFTLRSLTEFQKINHFPRSYEITRKDRLYKNVQRMQQIKGCRHFDFVANSFIMPGEYQDFCACFLKEKGTWIVKPVASSRGRGVFLVNHPDQVPLDDNLIVSRYIDNPLLIDGFKFDVRLYVSVTSYDPITVYLYEEGLTRFATVKYEKANRHLRNQCMHLTNYSVNKKSKDYVQNDDPDVEDYGNKWSLGAMLRYLKSQGRDVTALMMRIEDVVIKTILAAEMPIATACKMFMPFKGNCFELYGFDILIDENLKPWVLEVNLSPSLACDAPLDLKIKANMISDLITLSGLICHDPMMRTLQQSRRNQEVTSKLGARVKSAYARAPSAIKLKQRPQSANSSSGAKTTMDKQTAQTMAGLTGEEIKIVRRVKEEELRKGGWVRIFPSTDSWDLYGAFLQFSTTHNLMLHQRLYPDRHKSFITSKPSTASSTSLGSRNRGIYSQLSATHLSKLDFQGDAYGHASLRTRQYLRKLSGSSESRKKHRKKKLRAASFAKRSGSLRGRLVQGVEEEDYWHGNQCDEGREGGEEDREGGEEDREITEDAPLDPAVGAYKDKDLAVYQTNQEIAIVTEPDGQVTGDEQSAVAVPLESKPPDPTSSGDTADKAPSKGPTHPKQPPEPKVNMLEILENGGSLSKIQARTAFAVYLIRVQQRLLSECSTNCPEDTDAMNEQMDLVLRFLKRASVNLQQPFKVMVPSRKLPLNDRRRILAKQLADFVHVYNKETDQLRTRQQNDRKYLKRPPSKEGLNEAKFDCFINIASEGELEEVLTTYTKMNKSASIFLGTKPAGAGAKKEMGAPIASRSDSILVKRKETPPAESSPDHPPGAISGWEDHPTAYAVSNDLTRNERKVIKSAEALHRPSSAKSSPSTVIYPSPAAATFANAVAVYSAKLAGTISRSRPASASGSGQASRAGLTRPASAASSRPNYGTVHDTDRALERGYVDLYNEQAINDALQRLAMRQQARQYSAHNGTLSFTSEPPPQLPLSRSNSQNSLKAEVFRCRSMSIGDTPHTLHTSHTPHSSSTMSGLISMPTHGGSSEVLRPTDPVTRVPSSQGKYVALEEHRNLSRPPSGAHQRAASRADLSHGHSNTNLSDSTARGHSLKSANATFNNFIEDTGPSWQSDLAIAYNQVTGVRPNNYHAASQGSRQYLLAQQQQVAKQQQTQQQQMTQQIANPQQLVTQQQQHQMTQQQHQLLKQQRLMEQSKVLLESSKAKHQAMIAQVHASHNTVPPQLPVTPPDQSTPQDGGVQMFAPKPPPKPATSKKVNSTYRLARTAVHEDGSRQDVGTRFQLDTVKHDHRDHE